MESHNSIDLDCTLLDAVYEHGMKPAYRNWVKAAHLIEVIRERKLKNEELKNKLVAREVIESQCIEPMEFLYNLLLTDGVKDISKVAYNITESGGSVEDIKTEISEKISSYLRATKARILKAVSERPDIVE